MITLNDIVQDIENTFADCKICFDHNDVPADLCLPKSWERFGLNLESSPVYPQSWNFFQTNSRLSFRYSTVACWARC